jgi:hypothetical protein
VKIKPNFGSAFSLQRTVWSNHVLTFWKFVEEQHKYFELKSLANFIIKYIVHHSKRETYNPVLEEIM